MTEPKKQFFAPGAEGDKPTEMKLELVTANQIEAITRGEVDVQIRTAHQWPRSMSLFLTRATDMATIDVDTAESCIYVRPVGKTDGVMQYVEGLSVRMAEIVGASYGNLRVGSMIIEQTDRYVVTRGFAHDLETNFASTSENKEATVTKQGTPMSEGMRATIAKASLAKARRDATFQVVPKALCRPIENAARKLIAGDAKSLEVRRAAAVQFVQRLNILPERVWAALGIQGEADLTSDKLLILTGIRNSIKDSDTSIDEAFPPLTARAEVKKAVDAPPPAGDAPAATTAPTATEIASTAPAAAAATEVAPKPLVTAASVPAVDLEKTLAALMAEAGITEPEITAWAIKTSQIRAEDNIGDLSHVKMRKVIDGFASVKAQILAARAQ